MVERIKHTHTVMFKLKKYNTFSVMVSLVQN